MRKMVALALVVTGLSVAPPATAGIYANDLGKCMVARSSVADRTALVRWIFMSISSTPAIKDLVTVTDAQREANSRDIGNLISRLLANDCHKEAVIALKNESAGAIETSFGILGEAAMTDMMTDPKVVAGLSAPAKYLDYKALESVFREAGMKPPKSDSGA